MSDEPEPEPIADPIDIELSALYAQLDAAVAERAPVCQISGRCCRFQEYGHTLFLSSIEFEYLMANAPPPIRPIDDGATCPWQDRAGRCTARTARPLGCRVYFCDPAYEGEAPVLTERFLGLLKRLAERHDRTWQYAPLHRHLRDREPSSADADPIAPIGEGPAANAGRQGPASGLAAGFFS